MKRLLRISLGVGLAAALMASAFQVLAFIHTRERTGEVKLDAIEYAFEPDKISVDPGKVTFVIENKGRPSWLQTAPLQ
jgi:plastocyanin